MAKQVLHIRKMSKSLYEIRKLQKVHPWDLKPEGPVLVCLRNVPVP